MKNFGFNIHKSLALDLDNIDRSLFLKLADLEPDIYKCIGCGSCTSSCTAGSFTTLSFRQIILFIERGDSNKSIEMAKKCMLCGKCTLICPRCINTRNILRTLININTTIK